jgi:hypothetical protein
MTARRTTRASRRAAARSEKHASAPPPKRTFVRVLVTAVHRRPWAFALGLGALHMLLALLSFMPTPHTGGDNASYIALARSLIEQRAYLEMYDPGTPAHTQYPPGFPVLLAIALTLGLRPWVQLKLVIAASAAVGVALTFLWVRRRRRPLLALGLATLLAVSPGLLELGHWILSDVPFWMFTVLAVWAFERLRPGDRGRLAVAVLATTLAYFTRSAGLPLVIAAFAWLALRRRWTQLGVLAAVILPLAFLWWLRARGQGGVDYVSQFWMVDPYDPSRGRIAPLELLVRAGENMSKYVRIHLPILLSGTANAVTMLIGLLVLAFGGYGWVTRMRRPGVVELFLPLYLGLLCVWPSVWSGERFLLPAFPLLLLFAGDGLVRVARLVRPRAALAAATTATVTLLAVAVPGLSSQIDTGRFCTGLYRAGDPFPCLSPQWRDYFDVAIWAKTTLPDDGVVVTRKPRLWYGLSERRALIYPFTESADALLAAADGAGARYLVIDYVDGLTQSYVVPALLRRTDGFCLMHATEIGTAVLGIRPGAKDLPDAEPASGGAGFPVCSDEYWRNPADRDAAMRRMGVVR